MAAVLRRAPGSLMQADGLVLRDIHASVAPPWWPPAPGWWVVMALVALALGLLAARWLLRARRRRRAAQLFDARLDAAPTPAAQVAAMSELLRRAARRRAGHAERLEGEDWLRFLDEGHAAPAFDGEAGRLLLEGGYRRSVDEAAVLRLRTVARGRFVDWMARP